MIKTVKGVIQKLQAAKEKGYKYCRVSVDGNNIGCALINDIIDSIQYCCTPRGTIKTFIHRGYEYAVDEGVEIFILTDEEFLEHYIGLPCNKGLAEKEEDKRNRDILESSMDDICHLTHEEQDEYKAALSHTLKAKPLAVSNTTESNDSEMDDIEESDEKPKLPKKDAGLFARIRNWLKGDVGYKR